MMLRLVVLGSGVREPVRESPTEERCGGRRAHLSVSTSRAPLLRRPCGPGDAELKVSGTRDCPFPGQAHWSRSWDRKEATGRSTGDPLGGGGTMTKSERDQYEARLGGLGELVSMARVHQTILETLFMSGDPETERVLAMYRSFFAPVWRALTNEMFLHATSALDRDRRSASLPNVLKAARESPEFAPGVDIHSMQGWLSGHEDLHKALLALRNKRVAHFDVDDPRRTIEFRLGIGYGAFRGFLEGLHRHHGTLVRAFHGRIDVADPFPEARAHSAQFRQMLIDDHQGSP